MQTYDAVIVLGLNITRIPGGWYAPTTYENHDEYGMLAGEMNIIAAVHLFANRQTNTFVFSTGTSKKTIAALGPDVPTEAEVYSQNFSMRLRNYRAGHPELEGRANPAIILEDRSVNTYSNITEIFDIIRSYRWQKVAIVSAKYHVPRVQALCDLIQKSQPLPDTTLDFLVSEDIIQAAEPGAYDQAIQEAYDSEWGKKRLAIEAQGQRDVEEGRYVIGEFQFDRRGLKASAS